MGNEQISEIFFSSSDPGECLLFSSGFLIHKKPITTTQCSIFRKDTFFRKKKRCSAKA